MTATRLLSALLRRTRHLGHEPQRGDVPGWVLVTVMTAGIVVGLAAIAGPMLTEMFTQAISAVTVTAAP